MTSRHTVILVVTREWDSTSDLVIQELTERGAKVSRLNTESFPARIQIEVNAGPTYSQARLSLTNGDVISAEDVAAIYYRRPDPPAIDDSITDPDQRRFARNEASAAVTGFLRVTNAMWVNDPSTTALADAKVSQLFRARSIGFAIPRTIVTNNPQAARGFAVDCGGDLIAKSLRSPVVRQSPPAFVYTSRLSAEDIEAFDDLRLTPCILQERVHKSLEVRATVVGHSVFAAALDIHGVAGAGDDWRRVEASTIRHTRHELPEDIAQKCIELTHSFGLVFSAIDLILKPDGSYCFLECNPNGEWGWIVDMTGLPIARAIAEILVASQSDLH